jgi:methylated-DNA-[protein]-cysteine S-methyltransferase
MSSNRRAPASVFAQRVLRVLQRVPPGRVATYGDVAAMAGRPGAARAVGSIMRIARIPGLPYHRVVAAGGRVGGYGSNPQLKAALLRAEGLTIVGTRIRHFEKHRLLSAAGRHRLARHGNARGLWPRLTR